jgi:hypothetical protein
MYFSIPVKRLYARYAEKGFFMKAKKGNNTKYVARRMDKLVCKSPSEIIKYYNYIFKGLINYYSGSDRLSDLYGFLVALKRSAALTISHFYKKKTAKWAFNKYGNNLRIPLKVDISGRPLKYIELTIPSLNKKIGKNR